MNYGAAVMPSLVSGDGDGDGDGNVDGDGNGVAVLPTFKSPNIIQVAVRYVIYFVLVLVNYPFVVVIAFLRALYQRAVRGRVSDILRCHQLPFTKNGIAGLGMIPDYYPAQLVLSKPLDPAKLRPIFDEMIAEAGIASDLAELSFDESIVPKGFKASGPMDANHYVSPPGAENNWSDFMHSIFRRKALAIRIFSSPEGGATVLHCYLPGGSWDGTSCFNFMKELVYRYYSTDEEEESKRKNHVFRGKELTMTAAAKAKLDRRSFCAFLCRLPLATFRNTTSMCWGQSGTPTCLGGPGMVMQNLGIGNMEYTLINLDERESTALTAGLKKRGKKPFAGFVHAAVTAYRRVLGSNPYGIVMQASLQTRAYEPVIEERNLVGDWLVGPLQRVASSSCADKEYTLECSQQKYEQLLEDMNGLSAAVARAAEARAYGTVTGGAAMCEVMPFYPDDQRVWSGVFFNNYGLRSMHPDAGVVSWNWGAPFKLGFNTICVNGRTCICMASSLIGLPKLEAARDQAHAILREYIRDGLSAVEDRTTATGNVVSSTDSAVVISPTASAGAVV